VTSSGLVAVEAEAGGDDGEEVGVFVPADGGLMVALVKMPPSAHR
jgi:hypothetical protein